MAAPGEINGEFENWLNERLDSLEVDRDIYGVYIHGVLQEEENDEEKIDALRGILSAFLEEDALETVCQEIIKQWTDYCAKTAVTRNKTDAEVQAIASLIEKQAQIVVKQKEVSEEEKRRKQALLEQYAQITDDEDEDEEESAGAMAIPSDKSLFKNTNVEDVLGRKKQQRDQAKEDSQKKKEQDKMQREKDKLAKQERKDKEKKRTQKGERKR
ncbi:coiled-coil domain-containing protein 43 [Alosa sapidissima]|uniref:coiled-coil domain-containing protein 43 n=1 Tax=Alosa sapidissima TaxID=34773 RepID=UPI001C07F851|nr:coiled-coil domain-containing protein 43 [Alosa sapidissima]